MKNYLLGCLLATAWTAHAQAPVPFTLEGKLGKLNNAAKVYLWRSGKGFGDSATVKNGKFKLVGTLTKPSQSRLYLVQKGNRMRMRTGQADHTAFFLDKGKTTFTSPDSLVHASIKGPALTNEFEKLQVALKPSSDKMQALMTEYRAASPEQRKSPEFEKRMDEQDKVITAEANKVYSAHIRQNPNSLISLEAVREVGGAVPKYDDVAPLFALLSPELQASPEGKKYGERLEALKSVSIGANAPDFTLSTPEGKPVSLSQFRGKYVLVDFWASWCGPCRQENPNVTKVYNEYKTRNFDILGVSLDTEKARDKWLKAIQDDQLAWTQVSDLKGWENQAAKSYSIQAIPQNFLVDPSGKIVATNLRGEALKTTLAQFIK
ncbi:TlpA disulfide reductase family protein [Hymenobacter sp. GOD-10R]|uniref:TlpA disulfide reductase family protein n=1 Tax=Hymenobacter sp. GOD-10R TaxID=3093922 RepID=UPI002D796DF0|nr:TlpA disulfide reductase family protein [Hymenobacter sp. GOD-10R]WRQ29892.1 TlpA disulfide reductase family protein [Hymenobacter sp. GOD-10R]